MSRVKLSEFCAKSLLVPNYSGVAIYSDTIDTNINDLGNDVRYAVKVDQGIKKRGKQGLLHVNVTKNELQKSISKLAEKGFNRFIAEPMLVHENNEEKYVSFERTKDGLVICFSEHGGIDVEDHPESVRTYTLSDAPLPRQFLKHVATVMNKEHLSFVEVNPLIVRGDDCLLLDAAVLVDSAGEFQASWTQEDIVESHLPGPSEKAVAELNNNSTAAFSLRILNPNGALWLLLSGGGASITIADEAAGLHKSHLIGNYGEYSGGPTSEETYLYTSEVLRSALASNAPKKAIIIAGGVANFTDVKKTFKGILQALEEHKNELQSQEFKIFVRRGGPNEAEGLSMMRQFLEASNLYGSVNGSDALLTTVVHEALEVTNA